MEEGKLHPGPGHKGGPTAKGESPDLTFSYCAPTHCLHGMLGSLPRAFSKYCRCYKPNALNRGLHRLQSSTQRQIWEETGLLYSIWIRLP